MAEEEQKVEGRSSITRRQIFVEAFSRTSIQKPLFASMILLMGGGLNLVWVFLWPDAWIFGALIICAGWTLLIFSALKGLLNAISALRAEKILDKISWRD